MSAKIHQLPKATLADIPRVLRAIADEIDAGEYGEPVSAVVVLEADGIHTFGAGAADYYRALGLLYRGQLDIASKA